MGIKERLSGIFKGKDAASGGTLHAEPASKEEREQMLTELNGGFQHVGQVLQRLDHSLVEAEQAFQALAESQREMPGMVQAQTSLLNAIATQLQHRDEAQASMVQQLEQNRPAS